MQRPIEGYRRDDEGHFVARLSCGHGQHVRHDPPHVTREWVLSDEGRASRVGRELDCVRCDRRELPEGWAESRRTPVFTEVSVPKGLLARHTTARGVWGRIEVSEGRLRYRIHSPYHEEQLLEPGSPGLVLPEVEHEVEPEGRVRFQVVFLRCPAEGSGTGAS